MEEMIKELTKQCIELSADKARLLNILEILRAKPELINDEAFANEISNVLECCY